jgi:hypothetical protein
VTRTKLLVAGLVVAALGAVGVAVGLDRANPALHTGANDFVNDRSRPEAHNSPSVAADPRQPSTLVVANRLDAPEFGCALSVSTNGGASWRPLPRPDALGARNCFWPRVAFTPDGALLVLYTVLGGPNVLPIAVWLQRYENLRPAGAPLHIASDLAFWARLAVAGNRVWASWVQAGPATADNPLGLAEGDNAIVVARSLDGGRTFSGPVRVSAGERVIQPTMVAAEDGTVVVSALDLGDDVLNYAGRHDGQTPPDPALRWRVLAWTSTDAGASFGPAAVVSDDLAVPQLIIADLGPTPGLARDARTGRLYATWDAGRGDAREVFLARSDDRGRTWSQPVRVGPAGREQLLPAVGVSSDGRVDVVLYDRSRHAGDVLTETVVASSWDGGRTFTWFHVSDTAFDSRIGLGAQQGVPVLGDHLAVLSRPEGPLVLWADTSRATTLVETVQDLAVAVVEASPGGGRRWPLAVAGALGVALGVGALLVGLMGRSRRAPSARTEST